MQILQNINDVLLENAKTILDIGCGMNPHERATHLADFFVKEEDCSQHGMAGVFNPKNLPFEQCSVEETPYADKQFDFVICRQVLEHTPDPAKACRELSRIAKAGYIECPNILQEQGMKYPEYTWSYHRWLVSVFEGRIYFEKKGAESTFCTCCYGRFIKRLLKGTMEKLGPEGMEKLIGFFDPEFSGSSYRWVDDIDCVVITEYLGEQDKA